MNNFIKSPFIRFSVSIILMLANIALWGASVIILTALAVPSFVMWVVSAYLLSFLAVSTSSFKLVPKYLVPGSPSKLKRARMH